MFDSEEILSAYNAVFSRTGLELKDKQLEILQQLCNGHHTLAILPTGYGKSLKYTVAGKVQDLIRGCMGVKISSESYEFCNWVSFIFN